MKKLLLFSIMAIMAAANLAAQHHVCKGTSTSYIDIVYTYDDRHIYSGTSTNYTSIVYTFK